MSNVLITPTLLDAYNFAKGAPPSWQERAYNGFVSKIRREKTVFPEAAKKGIAFEDAVYRVCNQYTKKGETVLPTNVGSSHFQAVANACMGGEFQKVSKKYVTIDDLEVLFYSKLDVFFPDVIKDIKTTANYRGRMKYERGWQSKIYTWSLGVPRFEYIVAEWESKDTTKIRQIHTIDCNKHDLSATEDEIISGVRELFNFLHERGLYEDYFYTFSNNSR